MKLLAEVPLSDAKRIAFETMGCRSNYADTVELQSRLVAQGASPCSFEAGLAEGAEVFVLNTCTVTDQADKTVLRTLKKIRKQAPEARIVVTGCMAEVQAEELKGAGLGDLVVGPGQKDAVIDAALTGRVSGDERERSLPGAYPAGRKSKKTGAQFKSISLEGDFPEAMTGPGQMLGSEKNRARYHLRVQEGCENSCTFCIIPQTRGHFSSRSVTDILSDLEKLSELGYQEVILTGTHLGGYGIDIGESFFSLLKEVVEAQPKPRIRLSSIDPNDVSLELIDFLEEHRDVFCPHLHICIQAFCKRTLKRMNRLHGLEEALELVSHLAGQAQTWCIGADLIAGFPGETREEFDSSLELFESLPISYLHVFPYSERENTAATRLDGSVEFDERKRRSARFRASAERKRREFLGSLVGKKLEVVLENNFQGTSREFAPISIPESTEYSVGERVSVLAKELHSHKNQILCEL